MDESPLETVLASTCNGTPGIDNSISDYNWYFRDAKCHAYFTSTIIMDPQITEDIKIMPWYVDKIVCFMMCFIVGQ